MNYKSPEVEKPENKKNVEHNNIKKNTNTNNSFEAKLKTDIQQNTTNNAYGFGQLSMEFTDSSQSIKDIYANGDATGNDTQRISRKGKPLPNKLLFAAKSLTGLSLENVDVIYDSPKTEQYQSDGFVKNNEIHLAKGNKGLIGHETWHMIQRIQNRVRTGEKTNPHFTINKNKNLENEAHIMGDKLMRMNIGSSPLKKPSYQFNNNKNNSNAWMKNSIVQLSGKNIDSYSWDNGEFKKGRNRISINKINKVKELLDEKYSGYLWVSLNDNKTTYVLKKEFTNYKKKLETKKHNHKKRFDLLKWDGNKFVKVEEINEWQINKIADVKNVDSHNNYYWVKLYLRLMPGQEFIVQGYVETKYLDLLEYNLNENNKKLSAFGEESDLERLEYNVNKSENIDKSYSPWNYNLAIIMEAYNRLKTQSIKIGQSEVKEDQSNGENKKNEEVNELLDDLSLIILQSYSKTAGFKSPVRRRSMYERFLNYGDHDFYKIETSPLFNAGDSYYRSSGLNGNILKKTLNETVKSKFGTEDVNGINVVSDLGFVDVLHREYPLEWKKNEIKTKTVNGSENNVEINPNTVNTTITSLDDFQTAIKFILQNLLNGYKPKYNYIFDFSHFFASKEIKEESIKNDIQTFVQNIKKELTNLTSESELSNDIIKSEIDNKLSAVVIFPYKGLNISVLLKLNKFNPIARNINEIIQLNGLLLDPISAKAALLKFESIDKILEDNNITQLKLSEEFKNEISIRNLDFKKFIIGIPFLNFKKLSEENNKNYPDYVKIYSAATAALFIGLKDVPTGIDKIFEKKGILDVLQASYYRMNQKLIDAEKHAKSSSMVIFFNDIEFLHDQLQMILAIVKPHQQKTDFHESIINQLKKKPINVKLDNSNNNDRKQSGKSLKDSSKDSVKYSVNDTGDQSIFNKLIKDNNLTIKVNHYASAMKSFSNTLAATQKQKGNNKLNLLLLENTYYEAVGATDLRGSVHADAYNIDFINGGNKEITHKSENKDSESINKSNKKYDIFFGEIHHNISLNLTEYVQENLIDIINSLYEKQLVADKFTVVIDVTLDFIRSSDMHQVIDQFQDKIKTGNLNLVFIRSAQKFDMLGLDNYYGGYSITVNSKNNFNTFNAEMDAYGVSGLAHQGLTHVSKYAATYLDQYREAQIKNTKYFYQLLVDGGMLSSKGLKVAKIEDSQPFFVDILFEPAFASFFNVFKDWAYRFGLTVSQRPSFGFPTLNIVSVKNKYRINPGLTTREDLKKYADFIIYLSKLSNEEFYLFKMKKDNVILDQNLMKAAPEGWQSPKKKEDSEIINKRVKNNNNNKAKLKNIGRQPSFMPSLSNISNMSLGKSFGNLSLRKNFFSLKSKPKPTATPITALSTDKKIAKTSQQKNNKLPKSNYKKVEVAGDGNCFYRALAISLDDYKNYSDIKNSIADKLTQNRNLLPSNATLAFAYLLNTDENLMDKYQSSSIDLEDYPKDQDEFIGQIRKEGSWVYSDIGIKAAADALKINILIYREDGDAFEFTYQLGNHEHPKVNILYNGINHYDGIKLRESPPTDQTKEL